MSSPRVHLRSGTTVDVATGLERVLPGYRFQPLDVYALVPKGRLRVPRVAACLDVLRAAVHELT